MLAYPDVRRLVDVGDRYDNHPLHIAAQEGYLSIVKVGSSDVIKSKIRLLLVINIQLITPLEFSVVE